MESASSQLGIYDFFNVLLGGLYVVIGCFIICPDIRLFWIWDKDYDAERYVVFLVISYIIGIVMQETGAYLENKGFKIKDTAMADFIKQENIYVKNEYSLQLYRKYGKDFFKKRIEDDFTDEQCKYIFNRIYYIIREGGLSDKYDKMLALFDSATTLIAANIWLVILSIVYSVTYWWIYGFNYNDVAYGIVKGALFGAVGIVCFNRARGIMKNEVKILMGNYDAYISKSKNHIGGAI